jgi:hypothetical protein
MSSGVGRALGVGALLVAMCASGCVYPRRSTSLSPVSGTAGGSAIGAPADVVSLTIVSAHPNRLRRGGIPWDDNGSPPDCYVRVFRNEELVFETPTVDDSFTPEWNVVMPENFAVTRAARIRLEVWDRDAIGSDPVGIWRGVGLPESAMGGVEARVLLEGDSYLSIRAGSPRAHRGIGITTFEVRPGELVVVEVEPYSPAGRAGIVAGDRIIAIGGREVSTLTANTASGALSMAADRHEALRLRNERGEERVVELDRGYTYLVE